ncbi:hypothetical protein Tco_0436861 [Tanacetum coccineum]
MFRCVVPKMGVLHTWCCEGGGGEEVREMVMMTVVVWWGDSGVVVMERLSGGAWSRGSDRSIDEEYI